MGAVELVDALFDNSLFASIPPQLAKPGGDGQQLKNNSNNNNKEKRKKIKINIQQPVFAGRHRPNY
jgi:hypothetical protein